MTEHTILVAFTVQEEDRDSAEKQLRSLLPDAGTRGQFDAEITSWWIAEDTRDDGSDNDSAVFVSPGRQGHAAALLHLLDLTPSCNLVKGDPARWGLAETDPDKYAAALRTILQAAEYAATQGETDNPGYSETRAAIALLDSDGTLPATEICKHCDREITLDPQEGWIDLKAGYDDEDGDGIWRVTCDEHDTFVAEHEPK